MSGEISIQLLFPDDRTRAAVLDQMRIDGVNNPVECLLRSPNPPATLVHRLWMDTTDPDLLPPQDREIVLFAAFEVRPGREKEAALAFMDMDRLDHRLGAETELWVVRYGATSFRRHIRGTSFDSFDELRAFDEIAMNSRPSPTPLDLAVQAGVLERISLTLTTSIDLE
jgi:hypothetical protein